MGPILKIEIDNYSGAEVYLVKYLGDKAYIKDTLQRTASGQFAYQSEEKLASGIYYIVIPPKNEFVEILITEEEQDYKLQMDHTQLTSDREFSNAPQNALLENYRLFMTAKTELHREIITEKEAAADAIAIKAIDEKLKVLQTEVQAFQKEVIKQQPTSLAATIVKTQLAPAYPKFEGSNEERQRQQFWFAKTHFF